MALAEDTDIIDAFEEFYRNYYRNAIGELARKYPNDQRSLYVSWGDLYRFDQDLAEQYRNQPDQLQEYAEEALRLYDLPVDVSLGQAHVRVHELPDPTDIRDIRARHRGQLLAVRGIVRKATDVRPKIQEAAFECQRCGTLTRIPQTGGDFQEPHECQGCERQGPFRINFDQSEFIDAQKIRVQESPEGLRGGETPQNIDIHIEDDITGEVTAGDHVAVTGVLHLDQQESGQQKSAMFDIYMDGVAVEIEDEQFEEMDITDEDKREIVELSSSPDIYEKMVGAVAPSIYGYDQEKMAMIFQLFSGVTKHLPDGSRIRGDLHMLLIGDPGTGKCVRGDTRVTLADGSEVPIRDLVESNLTDPKPIDDGVYQEVDFEVPSLRDDGTIGPQRATKVWKREAPETMLRVRTATGHELEVTPSHPLFVQQGGRHIAVRAGDLSEGEFVATPRHLATDGDDTLGVEYRESRAPNAVRLNLPSVWTPSLARLVGYVVAEGYVERRADHTGYVSVTNNDREVLDDVANALDGLGLNYSERSPHDGKTARELVCSSGEFVSFLEALEPALLKGSSDQRVPDALMRATPEVKAAFLRAFVEGEGHVSTSQRELTVASTSRELLEQVRSLLLALGITSQLRERHNDSYRLRISGEQFARYVDRVGFVTARKSAAASAFDGTAGNTNLDVVPDVGDDLRRIREDLDLTQADCGLPRSTYQHYERGDRNPSRESLRRVVTAFEDRLANVETEDAKTRSAVAADGGVTELEDDVAALRTLADGPVAWDRIESIERVEPDEEWVYDLEIEGTHNYLTNNVVSHNSQMLSYIQNIAPRSVYTSGKGSSSAGLCVTGDTQIHTGEGFVPIRDLVTERLPEPVTEETAASAAHDLYTFDRETGRVEVAESSHVWRMPEKPCRRIETAHGKRLEASVNTPVLVCGGDGMEWREVSDVTTGDFVAVPRFDDIERSTPPVREFFEFTGEKLKPTAESVEFLRTRLREEFGTLRDAAAALDLSEDFIYDSLSNRHLPLPRLERVLDAIGADLADVDVEQAMLRHGQSVSIPESFDADLMYLVGLVFGDGDVMVSRRGENRGHVRISNSDEELLETAASIIEETFGKRVEIEYQDERVPCIRLHSATVARFFSNLGVESPKDDIALDPRLTTAEHADAFLQGLFDADGSVCGRDDGGSSVQFSTTCPELAQQVQLMLETYGIRTRSRERDRRGVHEFRDGREIESTSVQTHLAIYGAELDAFADRIGFRSAVKSEALDAVVGDATRRGERLPVGRALLRADGAGGPFYQNLNRGDNPSRRRARSMLGDRDLGEVEPIVEEAVEADLVWDEVVAAVDTGEKEVFDLTVPGTHNFSGNGLVTHNTAAAVRDDFGEGQQWSLEAGALVLADQGIAAVDELDKMRPEDRSAMHEALEQQKISVSKAGINATLKSRCSLLGAANPKYGRFDQYEPIGEQINLEPALISRFDLIFTVTDKPDAEKDRDLAEHIINTNYAGELHTHRTNNATSQFSQEEVDTVTEEVAPTIEPELLRKYIAYAKRNVYPTMTEEAKETIRDFYVDLRARGSDEDSPIPVTARKLEALVRLAEASARVRLSDTVEAEDAERVTTLVRSCLEDIGMDPETGEFDADIVETGTSKTQRDRIKNVKGIISEVEEEYDEGAPVEEVLDRAEAAGIERSKAEHEIEKLRRQGDVYEPQTDYLRTV